MFSEPSQQLDQLAKAVFAAAIEVHRSLGPGFPESVYETALAMELTARSIPFERQVALSIHYRGERVGVGRADFLVGDLLVVELKSVEQFADIHVAQVLSYLKAIDSPLGLLINFNVQRLRNGVRRVIQSRPQ